MKELPYMAAPAQRHEWARREYARLHADIVEARLAARVRTTERAARRRALLRARLSGLRPVRAVALRPLRAVALRRTRPTPLYCARAAARSAHATGMAGGVR